MQGRFYLGTFTSGERPEDNHIVHADVNKEKVIDAIKAEIALDKADYPLEPQRSQQHRINYDIQEYQL